MQQDNYIVLPLLLALKLVGSSWSGSGTLLSRHFVALMECEAFCYFCSLLHVSIPNSHSVTPEPASA